MRNLRLSGETLAKIFTNQITNWDDPAITKDNNGHALPSLPIIPVVHSEGSGSTAQFTALPRQASTRASGGRSTPDVGHHRVLPARNGQPDRAERLGRRDELRVVASAANGSIGYDEYSYALSQNYPGREDR